MAGQPWFKKWAGDYLSDSKIRLLTYEQRGILETLWAFAWQDGGIPARPEEQAILLGLPVRAMRSHSVWIARFFVAHPSEHDRLVSPRMELERQEAEAKSGKARESALHRWSKGNANAYANASKPDIRTHEPSQCEPDANSMLSVSESEETSIEVSYGADAPGAGAPGKPPRQKKPKKPKPEKPPAPQEPSVAEILGDEVMERRYWKTAGCWPKERNPKPRTTARLYVTAVAKAEDLDLMQRLVFMAASVFREQHLPPHREKDETQYMLSFEKWLQEEGWTAILQEHGEAWTQEILQERGHAA